MKNVLFKGASTLFVATTLLAFLKCNKIEDPFYKLRLAVENISPTNGPAGTQVTITGTGFSTATDENKVMFNGKKAKVTQATASSLLVEAPVDGTTGAVNVSVNGQVAEGPVFTYLEKARPQIIKIDPSAGWDYTTTTVTITGNNFGDDRDKVTVTFDSIVASFQSFSSTKLIVSPPKHMVGEADVVVTVNGIKSNTVTYTYGQKPVISGIYVDVYADHEDYFVAARNVAEDDSILSLTINGHVVGIEHVFRKGTPQYQTEPVGDKVITSFYVDESIGYVSIMDFVLSSGSIHSDPYRFVNEPRILDMTSSRHLREIYPGDTVVIGGMYLGTKNQSSKIEIWDLGFQTNYAPDPIILSWKENKIQMVMPSDYQVPFNGKGKLGIIVKENGKETRSNFFYIVKCSGLNEIYTGEYQYPESIPQPYAIEFFGNDSMYFTSSYDRYGGNYVYDCSTEEVTMDFAGHGVIVKAIRESNSLSGFTFIKSTGFNFIGANLNTTWNQNLDGTKWQEDILLRTPLGLEFTSGNKVGMQGRGVWYDYVRRNGTITFSLEGKKFFGYIENDKMELESNGTVIVLKRQ